jgi:hypothetical protein
VALLFIFFIAKTGSREPMDGKKCAAPRNILRLSAFVVNFFAAKAQGLEQRKK